MVKKSIELFLSYAHADELLRAELVKHLSILKNQGVISMWSDQDITAGSEIRSETRQRLETAQIILVISHSKKKG
jgi:hypothetical protein